MHILPKPYCTSTVSELAKLKIEQKDLKRSYNSDIHHLEKPHCTTSLQIQTGLGERREWFLWSDYIEMRAFSNA